MFWPRHTLHFENGAIVPSSREFRSPNGLTRIYLLVHGFNNDETQARVRYQAFRDRIAGLIGDESERIWEFYWPGYENVISQPLRQHLVPGVAHNLYTAACYFKQVPKARVIGRALGKYLLELRSRSHGTEVVLIGHSLGCRLILEAVSKIESSNATNTRVPAIFLMAGAVPVQYLEPGEQLAAAVRFPQRRIALYSRRDTVLRYTFPIGQSLARGETGLRPEASGLNGGPRYCWTARDQTMLRHGQYWADKSTTPNVVRLFGKSTQHALPYNDIVPLPQADAPPPREWRSPERKIGV